MDHEIPGVHELLAEEDATTEMKLVDNYLTCSTCQTTSQEWKKFTEVQEVGLDKGYKCPKCRDCGDCRKGEGQESMSLRQEAEQGVIRSSVWIDKELSRAVCKLAFIADPVQNLKSNRGAATKRLDSVCRKYQREPNVKEMIVRAVEKLKNKGTCQIMG